MSEKETPAPQPGAPGDETRTQRPAGGLPDPLADTRSRRADTPSGPSGRPPFVLGPYNVVRQLGRGGMGAVYLAVHNRLKKSVAVKILSPGRIHDREAVARFHREMEAVGALAHRHVVSATDAGEADGQHYLVMEYVDGFDLSTVVRLHGPLSVPDAAEAMRQVACGLQYIHENGRVHRDVKPSNLMLSGVGEMKILDLGLALLRGEGAGDGELTGAGEVMGTADYMAPEQWLDSHGVDIRADVYSLGCTLYKLLAGKAPFGDASNGPPFSKREMHERAAVPRIDSRRDLPAPFQAVLLRMLAKAPQERFATPAEVAEAMRPFTVGCDLAGLAADVRRRTGAPGNANLPIGTPANDANPEMGVPRRRVGWRAAVAAVLAVATALAAAAAFVFWPPHSPPPTPPSAPPLIAPFPLVWPRDAANSDWGWNPERADLRVSCDNEALIRLGEPAGGDYAFEVSFHQAAWGGAGVFFGHHADVMNGKPCNTFQAITLTNRQLQGGSDGYFLQWTEHRRLPNGGGASSAEALAPIADLKVGEQRLAVAVREGKLQSVTWNDTDLLPALRDMIAHSPAPQLMPTGASCAGAWGVYSIHSTVFFHNPRPISPGDP